MKMTDQCAGHEIAGHENAGHELTGHAKAKQTRKLCYRKDDRAMRPIHCALKIFGTP